MSRVKLAFDIGNSSLKIATVKNGSIKLHEVRMPENMIENDNINMPNAFSAFLKKIKKELKLPKGEAALVLPSSQAICRMVTMPKMTIDQLMLNLPYEFSDFIHGEPEQFLCDYAICDDLENQKELISDEITMVAAVASKERINAYIKMFSDAGFKLKILLPREISLIRLIEAFKEKNQNAPNEYCFIDIGQTSTQISMIIGDRIQATRQIPIGCRELDTVVADMLNVDIFLTDAYKRANSNNVLEYQQCQDIYGRIAVEVLKVINFYHFTYRNNNLNGVYLIGGGANIEPLRQALYEAVGMEFLDVKELIQGDENTDEICNIGVNVAGMIYARGNE